MLRKVETSPIAVGAERAELLAALAALAAHAAASQAWLLRDRIAAAERVVAAFDAMQARLSGAQPVGTIDPGIVARIWSSYEHAAEKRYLAVNLDMELVLAVLNAIDHLPT